MQNDASSACVCVNPQVQHDGVVAICEAWLMLWFCVLLEVFNCSKCCCSHAGTGRPTRSLYRVIYLVLVESDVNMLFLFLSASIHDLALRSLRYLEH